jgi:L-lysine 2,3-aminomutase
MSLPHDFCESESVVDAGAPVMNMLGPISEAEAVPQAAASYLHVDRSTLILPAYEEAGLSSSLQYLADREEISHVLLGGPDSLSLPPARLRAILEGLAELNHVRMIRFVSRAPAVQPERIVRDRDLLDLIAEHSGSDRSIYVMMRFHHPDEVNDGAIEAFMALSEAGAGLLAEVPFLPGTETDADTLAELLERLTQASVIPYQFVLDPAGPKSVTLERAYRLAEAVKSRVSGPARRARLTMKHESGFFEILAIENGKAYLKSHRSRHDGNGRFMIKECPPGAKSFEDLAGGVLSGRTGKTPSSATYLKVPYEIPD